jgi:hypothetical protein
MLMSSSLRDPADATAAWRSPPVSASTIDVSAASTVPDYADDQDSEQGAPD